MSDYKWDIQMIFEELCQEIWECDYWDVPQDEQYRIYNLAMRQYSERLADRADWLLDREREGK